MSAPKPKPKKKKRTLIRNMTKRFGMNSPSSAQKLAQKLDAVPTLVEEPGRKVETRGSTARNRGDRILYLQSRDRMSEVGVRGARSWCACVVRVSVRAGAGAGVAVVGCVQPSERC